MSKDQLGWDHILSNSSPENQVPAAEPAAGAKEKPSPQKQTHAKPAIKPSKVSEGEVQYSKKDWSKIEFPTAEKAKGANAAKDDGTVAMSPDSAMSDNKKTASPSSARAPIVIDPRAVVDSEGLDEELKEKTREPDVLTVSELNRGIREILEGGFPLIWLKGEISNFKAHTSGHFYFSLKDKKAQINAVMFKGFNAQLRFRPEDGMEVLVRGKITVYEPRGNYQVFCELMEPVGAGALQKAFEQLKAKLAAEGLFAESRKRPLPSLPRHIAIVTSPTGAAIRDMLNVLGRRFKGAHITVVPCKVQGDQAPGEIVEAIKLANRLHDVDVMIVGRGGGSIEDLWAFNDERVARAIASARVPVISAVGHEIDFTIADFVADLRAPTPSAAAELVVKNAADILNRLAAIERALRLSISRLLNTGRQSVNGVSRRLVDPQRRIEDAALRCDELLHRLEAKIHHLIDARTLLLKPCGVRLKGALSHLLLAKREALARNAAVLDSLSPLKVLDRGYSMVTVEGRVVTNAAELRPGQRIDVRMGQGEIEAEVKNVTRKPENPK